MIEHNGCVGCKYEQYDESCKECTNCTCNSHDKYIPSENYLDKLKIAELEEEVRQLKSQAGTSEVKHAHWVGTDGDDPGYESGHSAWIEFECSSCKYQMTLETGEYGWGYDEENKIPFDYCPHCGARMEIGE